MIIYGSKQKLIGTEIQTEKCINCGRKNNVQLNIFQNYAHVFWIPFFPTGKTGISQCEHCKQVSKLKELSPSTKLAYDNLKGQSKTPVWMFSGIAVLGLFILFVVYQGKVNDRKNTALILSPKQGDIFEIKTKDNQHTLYKVDNVQGDSVFVRFNQYETNKATGLTNLKRKGDAAYIDGSIPFLKSELKQMLEKGEIRDIDRQ